LNHSSRGAEVDAGPITGTGEIRTFLVNRIQELEVLEETFDRPDDADVLCGRARALTRMEGFVPHSGRWAIEKWAEHVEVMEQDADGLTSSPTSWPRWHGAAA
jgi:hypothetical protein